MHSPLPLPLRSCIVMNPPHFFTVVLQLNLDHKKLMIPRNFITDYGKFLSSSITLKIPDGMKWKMGLTKTSNGAVWMQNGWHEFAQHYSLEFGSFIVFRFDGDSTFHSMIFDMNGSEIKYCRTFEQGDDSPQSKKNKASFSSDMQFPKKMKNEVSFCPKREPQEQKGVVNILKNMASYNKNTVSKQGDVVVALKKQASDCKKAEPGAPKFRSSNLEKPGFKVVMKQSNVGGRFDMITRKNIAGKYLSEEFGMIRVQTSNDRTWSLVYRWSPNQGNFAYISSGWTRFAKDNLLIDGDIGLFQLIQKDQFLFTKLQQPKSNKTTTTRNPFFEKDFHLKFYKNILTIPSEFSNEHLSPEMHTAKLQVGKKKWEVKLKKYDNHFRFSAGWASFYQENRLEDASGLFEMVNKKDCAFKVTIFNDISSTSTSEED